MRTVRLTRTSKIFWLSIVALLVGGLAATSQMAATNTIVQNRSPEHLRRWLMAVYATMFIGARSEVLNDRVLNDVIPLEESTATYVELKFDKDARWSFGAIVGVYVRANHKLSVNGLVTELEQRVANERSIPGNCTLLGHAFRALKSKVRTIASV